MISKISNKITERLAQKSIISEDETELFHYGLFVIFSELSALIYCLFVGTVLKVTLVSALFYVLFLILHRFAGGFHVKTELCCQIITSLIFLMGIVGIKLSVLVNSSCLMVICVFSSVLLVILSPADTPQKPIKPKERVVFKKITLTTVVIGFILVIILNLFRAYIYANTVVIAIVMQTISVILGKLFNKNLLTSKT